MNDRDRVIAQITDAFAGLDHPGDSRLRRSNEGDEPLWVEDDFSGKTDWQGIGPDLLDGSPNGLGTALCFFSDEAFRFFLPAFLIADIRGQLERVDPVFHLIHGLEASSKNERINPLRYGERTWFDGARHKFAMFTRSEAAAIVSYLALRRDTDEARSGEIDEALANYWDGRAAGETDAC